MVFVVYTKYKSLKPVTSVHNVLFISVYIFLRYVHICKYIYIYTYIHIISVNLYLSNPVICIISCHLPTVVGRSIMNLKGIAVGFPELQTTINDLKKLDQDTVVKPMP